MSHSGWVFPSSASPKMITFIQAFILPKINCIIHIVMAFKLGYRSLYCVAQNNSNGNWRKVGSCLLVAVPSRKHSAPVFDIYWLPYKPLKCLYLKFPSVGHHSVIRPQRLDRSGLEAAHLWGHEAAYIPRELLVKDWRKTFEDSLYSWKTFWASKGESMLDKVAENHGNPVLFQINQALVGTDPYVRRGNCSKWEQIGVVKEVLKEKTNKQTKKKWTFTKSNTNALQRENAYFQTFGNFQYYTVLHKVRQCYFLLKCHSI